MARIRSVKPALRTSQVVASWPREVRYFFVLLWGYLDDEGRGLDVPKTIAGDCFPHDDDVTPNKINKWLDLMAKTKLDPNKPPPICRYEVGGRRLVHCLNWDEHQRPNRPTPSVIAHCPVHEPLTESGSEPPLNPHGGSTEDALSPQVLVFDSRKLTAGEVDSRGGPLTEPPSPTPGPNDPAPEPPSEHLTNPKSAASFANVGHHGLQEGSADGSAPAAETPRSGIAEPRGTAPPPDRCQRHLHDPDPPNCGKCGDARRVREAWDIEDAAAQKRARALADSARARDQANAAKSAIDACRLCDSTGYHDGGLCTHDPDQPTRTRRGAAAARDAIAKKPTTEPETTDA